MGGRGASSGISKSGKKYGTEYITLLKSGNIKFIRRNDGAATAPMETMTQGRVYATINNKGVLKSISFYDNKKRIKQIDLVGRPHMVNGKLELPHVHVGYLHDEGGTRKLTKQEKAVVENAMRVWYNRDRKQ